MTPLTDWIFIKIKLISVDRLLKILPSSAPYDPSFLSLVFSKKNLPQPDPHRHEKKQKTPLLFFNLFYVLKDWHFE